MYLNDFDAFCFSCSAEPICFVASYCSREYTLISSISVVVNSLLNKSAHSMRLTGSLMRISCIS